jgi:8-oxo-dGTP diphosphatase
MKNRPNVGIGIIIENADKKILVGKRIGSHAPFYSIPGGHLEVGETFEEAAIKEVLEETGLKIHAPKVLCVTNNLKTFKTENKHHVSVTLYTNQFEGVPKVMEKEKCESWEWLEPTNIPNPQFDASEFAVECFLKKKFYIENQG